MLQELFPYFLSKKVIYNFSQKSNKLNQYYKDLLIFKSL